MPDFRLESLSAEAKLPPLALAGKQASEYLRWQPDDQVN
jgi:hypothetical protein